MKTIERDITTKATGEENLVVVLVVATEAVLCGRIHRNGFLEEIHKHTARNRQRRRNTRTKYYCEQFPIRTPKS